MASAPTFDPGRMRHRVVIQTKTESRDAHGGFSESWSTADTVWAEIIPSTGREFYYGQQVANDITHIVTIRSNSNVSNTARLLFESTRALNIRSFHEPREITNYMILHCTEAK